MKNSRKLLGLAILFLSTGSAFATGNTVGTVAVTSSGSNQVTSNSGAGSYVNGAGSSLSKASNKQTAEAYVRGDGGFSVAPSTKYVTTGDCQTSQVTGSWLQGNVSVQGGTFVSGQSNASNVSTGAGSGGAGSGGLSLAEVAAKTTGSAPNMDLVAQGNAFSGALTSANAGQNAQDKSTAVTGSAFQAAAGGSLFKYQQGGLVGDVKSSFTNAYTRSGDVACKACQNSVLSQAVNASIEAGATATGNAVVKNTWSNP